MKRISTSCALACILLASCSQDSDGPGFNKDRADILDSCQPSRVMMILDQSSSMQTGTINGQTKWSIAVTAIDALTAEFENTLQMGLMTFPSAGQCSPGTTLIQPDFGQRAATAAALATAPPASGNWTPMAETLAAAAQEPTLQITSGPGERYALLITDGWQWCSPYDAGTRFNAVDRVQELKDMGVTTYVVGFGASVDARALNLMAVAAGTDLAGCDSTGSSPGAPNPCYYQADSPLELQSALQDIVVSITGEECDGLDNDCDGLVDENLNRECSSACGDGTESCASGVWAGCTAPAPEAELCDGLDNDCDGETDPGCGCVAGEQQACGTSGSVGECSPGTQTCNNGGQWDGCTGDVGPSEELCDGLDNDCNGIVDDLDAVEICDGLDNDCDGSIDEGLVQVCSTACGLGEETCQQGSYVGCDAPPTNPDICDGLDNDCDGTADNDCDCLPGETIACGESEEGECRKGEQTCDNSGQWGACVGDQGPELEFCDEKDNDCDGKIDESNGMSQAAPNDDVAVICPTGDDNPEVPAESDDPEPEPAPDPPGAAVSNCSTGGPAGSIWLVLALLALVGIRRRDGDSTLS
ncbi:MAG: VWA domain-containing protein [Kofleriaceae bacterium]|nr:VWA domain-containing protein [Kofleriaceae bacterium]